MASGDVVSFVSTATGWRNYQPAASVEMMILGTFASAAPVHQGLTDGTNNAFTDQQVPASSPVKIAITNTYYLHYYSPGVAAFSGIQIK